MTLYKKRYRIESIRLPNYDYSQERYFITILYQDRQHLFGEIVNNEMQLSNSGKIANCIRNKYQNILILRHWIIRNYAQSCSRDHYFK